VSGQLGEFYERLASSAAGPVQTAKQGLPASAESFAPLATAFMNSLRTASSENPALVALHHAVSE